MYVVEVIGVPRVEHMKIDSLKKVVALPTNTSLDCKSLPKKNTLA